MANDWFPVETGDSRFRGEGSNIFRPFYRARVLDTRSGNYIPLFRGGSFFTGKSSVRRAVKYSIDLHLRKHPDGAT